MNEKHIKLKNVKKIVICANIGHGLLFGISVISFFTLRCFQCKEFNRFQTINQLTESPNVPHLLAIFVKTVIQHFKHIFNSDSNFAYKKTER